MPKEFLRRRGWELADLKASSTSASKKIAQLSTFLDSYRPRTHQDSNEPRRCCHPITGAERSPLPEAGARGGRRTGLPLRPAGERVSRDYARGRRSDGERDPARIPWRSSSHDRGRVRGIAGPVEFRAPGSGRGPRSGAPPATSPERLGVERTGDAPHTVGH